QVTHALGGRSLLQNPKSASLRIAKRDGPLPAPPVLDTRRLLRVLEFDLAGSNCGRRRTHKSVGVEECEWLAGGSGFARDLEDVSADVKRHSDLYRNVILGAAAGERQVAASLAKL